MVIETIGDEIWVDGFLAAKLVEGVPAEIRYDFVSLLNRIPVDVEPEDFLRYEMDEEVW